MSITFATTAQTTTPKGATVTCTCEETVYASVATFGEASAIADDFNRDGGIRAKCCGSFQTWPMLDCDGEDLSVNMSTTNATRVLEILDIAPDYCGEVPATVMADSVAGYLALSDAALDSIAHTVGLRGGGYLASVLRRLERLATVDIDAGVHWA